MVVGKIIFVFGTCHLRCRKKYEEMIWKYHIVSMSSFTGVLLLLFILNNQIYNANQIFPVQFSNFPKLGLRMKIAFCNQKDMINGKPFGVHGNALYTYRN